MVDLCHLILLMGIEMDLGIGEFTSVGLGRLAIPWLLLCIVVLVRLSNVFLRIEDLSRCDTLLRRVSWTAVVIVPVVVIGRVLLVRHVSR
jgi:hypothetical protein